VSILAALAIALASDSIPAIVPRPAHVTVQPGAFTLRAATVIVTDRALVGLGERLADCLFPATGLRLAVRTAAPAGTAAISIRLDSSLARLGDEGYRLDVSRSHVAIRAYRAAGAFYGIETAWRGASPRSRSRTSRGSRGAASTWTWLVTSCRRSS